MHARATVLALLLALAWTGGPAIAQPVEYAWRVEGVPPSTMPQVAKALEGRFNELRSGLFTSVSASVSGNLVRVVCKGWTPPAAQAERLATTAGRLRMYLESDAARPLISDSDIADAVALIRDGRPELAIRLTESAAGLVSARTKDANGIVRVEWDEQVVNRIRLAGQLPRNSALSVPSHEDAQFMAMVLRAPRMPEGARLVRVQN